MSPDKAPELVRVEALNTERADVVERLRQIDAELTELGEAWVDDGGLLLGAGTGALTDTELGALRTWAQLPTDRPRLPLNRRTVRALIGRLDRAEDAAASLEAAVWPYSGVGPEVGSEDDGGE